MLIITEKIKKIIEKKNLSENKLSKIIDYHSGSLNKIITGKEACPDHLIEKLAPILEVSVNEIKSWFLADKYSKKVLLLALKVKKEFANEGKLVLTTKIDEFCNAQAISRTALSKIIKHSQSGFNRIVIGKETLSRSVINKLSIAMAVGECEIKSWVVADKYSKEIIELAIGHL